MKSWVKTFSIIWTGQLFSTLSSSVVGYAVVFWLSLKTGSAEVLAFSMIASLLPQIVLGLFTGVFIDRWDRKRTMILADSFIACCTGVMFFMFLFDSVEIWQIYILLAMRSVGSAFHMPAMQASIPLLAPESQLMRIAGINQIIYSISTIIGPAIAAVSISLLDMTYVMLFDVLGAVIACTSLLFVKIPNPKKEEKERHIIKEIIEGLHAIFSRRGLAFLFVSDMIAMFFIIPVSVLFPLMATQYFMGDEFHMSVVETLWGVGMLLGGGLVSLSFMKKLNKAMLIAMTCVINGLTFVFTGMLSPSGFVLFVVLAGISGIAAAIWNSAFTVILQTKIEHSIQGRVFSTYDSLMLMPSIPGLLATGFIAGSIGMTNAFLVAGGVICALGVILFMIPSVRKIGRVTPDEVQ